MNKDILVRSDNSEIFEYTYPDFRIYAHKGLVSTYPRFRATAHWHEDLEFISVLQGSMVYAVNGESIPLQPGTGIFVNSRQLHNLCSPNQTECVYLCMLLHPTILSATEEISLGYVSEYLNHPGIPFCQLNPMNSWQKEILNHMDSIYSLHVKKASPLRIQGRFLEIWATLTENASLSNHTDKKGIEKLEALKSMLRYLHAQYATPITLDKIASVGYVGKSTCTEIFKAHLHETPINYLIHYRLDKAAQLLRTTSLTVTEIAYAVGFTSPSYFSYIFRNNYHCSPSSYRNQAT